MGWPLAYNDGMQTMTRHAREVIPVGSVVRLVSKPETSGVVIGVNEIGDQLRYTVFHDGTGNSYLADQIEEVLEQDQHRLVTANELHAALTSVLLLDPDTDYLRSRNTGRVDFEPYQYRPVLKLVQADRPRILIADDVGVGKTIEACLIIKELEARRRADSVLIICPRPLVVDEKWRNELKRFDEDFIHLDSKTLRWCLEETAREGVWPSRYRKAIVPYSLLDEGLLTGQKKNGRKGSAGLNDIAEDLNFDLVIVDEAHHIRNRETKAYQCVQRFINGSDAAVMLSATPIQTHSQDLFTLVDLLRNDLVHDRDDFLAMLEPNQHLYSASQAARQAGPDWASIAQAHLDRALATQWGSAVLAVDPRTAELTALLAAAVPDDKVRIRSLRLVEALNTFSEIVTRTRRRDIGEFTTRKPSAPMVEFTGRQAAVYDAVLKLGEQISNARAPEIPTKFLLSTLYRQAASSISGLAPMIEDLFENRLRGAEMASEDEDFALHPDQISAFRSEVRHIQQLAAELVGADDPKAELLRQVIDGKASEPNNKVLVFSTFRHTIAYLEECSTEWGLRVGVMHGGTPDEDRKAIRRRFKLDRSEPEALDVMLCSEVGTEGLDYQFCNTLVNYDIPWNPMRIEQRIGRIDRRGQKSESVAIINLLTVGTIEAEIYARCLSRIGVFNHAIGGSEQILGEVTSAIVDIATNLQLTAEERAAALRQLADNEIARVEEEQRLEDEEADLLGYRGRGFEEDVAEASSEWLSEPKIALLIRRYFDTLQPGRSIALRPGRVARIPLNEDIAKRIATDLDDHGIDAHHLKRKLRRDTVVLRLTTDPDLAEDDDDTELLGAAHPLVRLAARQSFLAEPFTASLSVASDRVAPGSYRIGIYSWTRLGSTNAHTLRLIADDADVEEHACALVAAATDGGSHRGDVDGNASVDERHAALWVAARRQHRQRQNAAAERRVTALRAQKARRVAAIRRQLENTGDESIRGMKEGELRGTEADFDRLIAAQEQTLGRADLTTRLLANVTLEVVAA